jgi:hypothetical protein
MSPNTLLAVGLVGCAALVVVALTASRFLKKEPPPPPPPPPPAAENTVTGLLRYTEGFYKASLDDDFKKLGVPKIDVTALAKPLVYADETKQVKKTTLKADRDVVETPHLKVSTHTVKEWAMTSSGQGFRYEHILLEITNRSDKPIAYHVITDIDHPEKCKSKGAIQHNAIALKPGETVRRTECLWKPGATLSLKRLEVLELNDLGYYYVSRLQPTQVLLDERTAAGHEPPKGTKLCAFVPWREIQSAAAGDNTSWEDVMDFYARHNCDEYSFWRGYHRWTTPGALPSHASEATAPPTPARDGG